MNILKCFIFYIYLLEFGIIIKDVNIQTKSKMTPLHFLIKYNVYEIENNEETIILSENSREEEEEENNIETQKQLKSDKIGFKRNNKYLLNQVIF
jgi:hypothetical protein